MPITSKFFAELVFEGLLQYLTVITSYSIHYTKLYEIINLHEYAGKFVQKPISIFDSVEIAQAIKTLDIPPAKLDIGKLTYEFHLESGKYTNATAFVARKLKDAKKNPEIKPKDVVLYGFGRIGRLVARELMARTGKGSQLRLRAIVTRGNSDEITLEKRASLLRNDSVHGDFSGTRNNFV